MRSAEYILAAIDGILRELETVKRHTEREVFYLGAKIWIGEDPSGDERLGKITGIEEISAGSTLYTVTPHPEGELSADPFKGSREELKLEIRT